MLEVIKPGYSHDLVKGISEQLSNSIDDYIKLDPSVRSVNSLSKECSVSEATLRRIYKKKLKTIPTTTTILKVLALISGESSIPKIINSFPGPTADYLKNAVPDSNFIDIEFNSRLNDEFEDSTKYLIYKLASNRMGVTRKRVQDLFGSNGCFLLQELSSSRYVTEQKGKFYSTSKNFHSCQGNFIKNFKAVSNFVDEDAASPLVVKETVRVNYSESVDKKTYDKIIKIQRNAISKIRDLMADEKNAGEIPSFMLVAVDTMDFSN